MTAPAVVTTPVGNTAANTVANTAPVVDTTAPATPVVETKQETLADPPRGLDAMIKKINERAVPPELAQNAASVMDTGDPVADPAPVADPVADPAPLTEGGASTPPVMVTKIASDEPEGEVVLRARDPETGQFSPMDQSKTYELSIRDKSTGETRVYNKNLPELMRLAKDGIAMQKSRDELSYYREQVPQWQQTHSQIQQEVDGFRALAMELLTADEGTVIARREAYAAEQSPEKKLARLEAQIRSGTFAQNNTQPAPAQPPAHPNQSSQQNPQLEQQKQALASRIGPIVQSVEDQVGPELAAGKLIRETTRLMVNGVIPPERFAEFEAYVQGPYREWATAQATAKQTADSQAAKTLEAATAERQRAQLAARNAGTATRPSGVLSNAAPAPQSKPQTRGVNDVINNIVRRPLQNA